MEKYIEFVNETATKTVNAEGDFVFFKQEWHQLKGIKDNIAQIVKIEPCKDKRYAGYGGGSKGVLVYTLKFEKPIEQQVTITRRNAYGYYENKVEWEETDTIGVLEQNMLGHEIVPSEYVEGVKAGRLTKYQCTGLLESIFKSIKFKVKAKYCDSTYFDADREKDDMISYLPVGRMKDLKLNVDDEFAAYKAKGRQEGRVGRVLKKLNPDLTDPQVENFVAEYKAAWQSKMEHINDRLKVVIGSDIQYWYLSSRYAKGGGSLNQSCMSGKESQGGIAFYANNPECIALAILLDEDDKLLARALIWRCSTPAGTIFMDRIYSVKPQHETMMKNFARDNGIMTKAGNSIVYGYSGKTRMEVKIKPWHGQWPYLDTFQYDHNKKVMAAG